MKRTEQKVILLFLFTLCLAIGLFLIPVKTEKQKGYISTYPVASFTKGQITHRGRLEYLLNNAPR